jgi:hypothetical protein
VIDATAAEHFGEIAVTPITIVSGETHHGYREFRIQVDNHSIKTTHSVTLVYPENTYNSGNAISRLSRTISIGPASSAMVPLWQPPLPINGNNLMRVLVDDEVVGSVSLPDPPRHYTYGAYAGAYARSGWTSYNPSFAPGGVAPTTILTSRSLNYDELNRVLNGGRTGAGNDFSAQMATGAPDSARRGGFAPTAWMPNPSSSGPQWLELDYTNPQPAQGVRIYPTIPLPPATQILVKGVSGTNLFHTNSPAMRGRRMGAVEDFVFPLTSEPVKTVRLEFSGASPRTIGIDAVELVGPSGSKWATDARASSEATGTYGSYGGPVGASTRGLLRTELPMDQWSDAWLSYTPYDGIALSEADLKALPPAAFSALWSYVECGGNLFVFGAHSVPDAWSSLPNTAMAQGKRFDIGVGRCFLFEEEKASALTPDQIKVMEDAADVTARSWLSLPDEAQANESFPVVLNFKVPVRSTIFVMLVFVIAIGPVNLIVLSKMNRRTWLLWTIPAISFCACVSVFAYSFLREGVTPDTRISGLTVLDQANRRGASIGFSAYYCPLTPSQGLFFSSDTEATPLVETWNGRGGTDREVDWTGAQHLGRGWVSARVPAHFELRKAETRRERLELESANGQLTAVNGLGAPIERLWLADGASRIYLATNVPAGQKVTLSATGTSLRKDDQLGVRTLLEKCGPQANLTGATSYLLPNTYIAELAGNPFFENGLGPRAQAARTKSHAVVYGTIEPLVKP